MLILEKLSSKYKPDFIYAKQWSGLYGKLRFFFPEIIHTITSKKGETAVRGKNHQSEF